MASFMYSVPHRYFLVEGGHVPITCRKDQRDQAYCCFIESLAVPGHFQLFVWWLHKNVL